MPRKNKNKAKQQSATKPPAGRRAQKPKQKHAAVPFAEQVYRSSQRAKRTPGPSATQTHNAAKSAAQEKRVKKAIQKAETKLLVRAMQPKHSLALNQFIRNIYSPESSVAPLLPASVTATALDFVTSRQSWSFDFDISAMLYALQTNDGPVLCNPSNIVETLTPVWPTDVFLMVHTFDTLVPVILPAVGPGTVDDNNRRLWSFPVHVYDSFHVEGGTDGRTRINLVVGTGLASPSGRFDPRFGRRPPSKVRMPTAMPPGQNFSYVWLDANGNLAFPARVNINCNFRLSYAGSDMLATFWVFRMTETGEVSYPSDVGTIPTSGSPPWNFTSADVAVHTSGWYRFAIDFVYNNSGAGISTEVYNVEGVIAHYETRPIYTAFWYNESYALDSHIGQTYWPLGSSLLVSPRFPKMVIDGDIFGYRADAAQINDFYAASSLGTSISQKVPLHAANSFNGTSGGPLSQGIFSVQLPARWPESLLVMSEDLGDAEADVSDPISYLVGCERGFGGLKVIMMAPSEGITSSTAPVHMRVTTTTTFMFSPIGQTLHGNSAKLVYSDELERLLSTLSAAPTFTENPLHPFLAGLVEKLRSGAVTAAKAGLFTHRLLTTIAPYLSAAAAL